MIESMNVAILIVAGLVSLSIFSSLLSTRIGAPLLLVFLTVGLLAGEDGLGHLRFDDVRAAYLIGSVALAVILFDSGFHTGIKAFRSAAFPALTLASLGVLITTSIVAVPVHYVLGMGWIESALLGSIVSSTDAAAVFFLLRVGGLNLRDRVRSTLEVESGSNDPMAIFLTLSLVGLLAGHHGEAGAVAGFSILSEFFTQFGVGALAGMAGGGLIVFAVNRMGFERGLQPLAAISLAMVVFAATGVMQGSGFLAVYIAGLIAGNAHIAAPETMRRFQEGLTWLAQIVMFLTLGLLATPSQFPPYILGALSVAVVLMFIARPFAAWLCLLPFGFKRNDTSFIAWVGLRGSVSVLLSIVPMVAGLNHGRDYFIVTFLVVLVSLTLQGWTIAPVARFLGQVVPRRIGPVERMELEIPGARHELVAYRVVADSLVARGQRLPRWAEPSLVLRDGRSFGAFAVGALRPGDTAYLFARPERVPHLDRMFASAAPAAEADHRFFGDFGLAPRIQMKELAVSYGLTIPPEVQNQTAAEWMIRQLGHTPGVGDRVALGEVELIVRSLDWDDTIAEIGLAVEPTSVDRPRLPLLFQSPTEILNMLRRFLRRRDPPKAVPPSVE
ncbi:potassium/proton antiporter [Magnetospirillum molischianum]|uniref:Cell volume regulation protein A homolog n=1 Tax=Magnetospirillum molischianum DSM 120 TaxID=1150626 RepID=H8FV98_MAGML|nr:potassium/proton antiporter [Magnetospirillum molischianum]CCG42286.1 Cell volume regulation protein A homolog [Magnetospirillum molischianum DSM 120]